MDSLLEAVEWVHRRQVTFFLAALGAVLLTTLWGC